ncbi:DUF3566 domain-containing protein [Geodermatophilus sp. URMC 60]
MSDRTQGSVRTGSRTGDTTPAQGTATGQQPAADDTPSVGSTQTIPGANTARTQAVAADGAAPAATGPASGTQTAVPPATGAQPAAGAQASGAQTAVPPATGAQQAAGSQAAGAQAAGSQAAGAQPAAGAARASSGGGKAPRGPRRARLQLRHIDTFSALKISLVLSIAMFFIWMVAVGLLYGILSGLGVFETLNDLFGQLGSASGDASGGDGGSEVITPGIVFGGAAVIGAINIVLMTALCTVAAFIYNMCSDLVGGLEVTLSERD